MQVTSNPQGPGVCIVQYWKTDGIRATARKA